jgi:hypothetical protein
VKEYRFRALVTFCSAAGQGAARGYQDGTPTRCIVQPASESYLPAVISLGRTYPPRPAVPSVVTIPLADGEAQAFFAPGQRFIIWADVMVDHTIWGRDLLGHGVITAMAAHSRADAIHPYAGTEATSA